MTKLGFASEDVAQNYLTRKLFVALVLEEVINAESENRSLCLLRMPVVVGIEM